jgi:hypothetical protein
VLLVLYVHMKLDGQMQRYEAVALLKELGAEHLIQPSLVLIEQRTPDRYELQIKGFYDLELVRAFTQQYNLTVKEENIKGYLVIF